MALVEAFLPNSKASLTVAAGAAAVSTVLPPGETIEVQNAASGTVFFELGSAITAAVAATGTPVLQNGFRQFRRPPGVTHISIIAPSGTGSVYLTGGAGAIGSRLRSRGKGAGGPSGPVAIFDAPLTTTLVPNRAGDPTFTFTRATTAYVADNEGILRNAVSGEARFQGARRVRNYVQVTSENFNNAAWVKANAAFTAGIVDPLGGTAAFTLTATANGCLIYNNMAALFSSADLCVNSIWIRRRTGVNRVYIRTAGNTDIDITSQLTSSWKRFSSGAVAASACFNVVGVDISGDAVDIAWAQTENVSGQSNTAPGEYVSVGVLSAPYHGAGVDGVKFFGTINSNVVNANVVTEVAGTAIPAATMLGYVAENQATNLCQQSQTFDSWTATNSAITANTQAAPDGSLTADTFTDNATSAFHRVYMQFAVANGTTYASSIYAKAGTLTWMQLTFSDGVSTRWANFNLVTGAVGNKHAAVTATIVALPNGWYRCAFSCPSAATGTGDVDAVSINADTATPLPAYVGTGQTMYLWGAQVEASSDASSYVPTTTAAVTRNSDLLSYTSPVGSTVPLTTYAEWLARSAATVHWVLHGGVNGSYACRQELSVALYNEVINTVAVGTSPNPGNLTVTNKGATRWKAGDYATSLNGAAVGANANAATPLPASPFYVGTNGSAGQNITIRNVRVYASALTNADLVTLTT